MLVLAISFGVGAANISGSQRVSTEGTATTSRLTTDETSTTAPRDLETTTSAVTPTTEPSSGATQPGPATSTTLQCRNSTDPRCGAFYWDPDPEPSSLLTVSLSVEPANPRVGEQVTVTADVHDPDTPFFFTDFMIPAGDGGMLSEWTGGLACSAIGLPPRYGPWTPPDRQPTQRQQQWHYTYRAAGTYTIRVEYRSGACEPEPPPYRGTGSDEVTVTVSP